jgi:hypothetical protein
MGCNLEHNFSYLFFLSILQQIPSYSLPMGVGDIPPSSGQFVPHSQQYFPSRQSTAIPQYSSATLGRLPPASAPIQRRIFGQPGQQTQSLVGPYGMAGKKILYQPGFVIIKMIIIYCYNI